MSLGGANLEKGIIVPSATRRLRGCQGHERRRDGAHRGKRQRWERGKRALARALLDAQVRREYRKLRAQGLLVQEAVETLAARHHCSEETIRTIIYGKRERQTRSQRG